MADLHVRTTDIRVLTVGPPLLRQMQSQLVTSLWLLRHVMIGVSTTALLKWLKTQTSNWLVMQSASSLTPNPESESHIFTKCSSIGLPLPRMSRYGLNVSNGRLMKPPTVGSHIVSRCSTIWDKMFVGAQGQEIKLKYVAMIQWSDVEPSHQHAPNLAQSIYDESVCKYRSWLQ